MFFSKKIFIIIILTIPEYSFCSLRRVELETKFSDGVYLTSSFFLEKEVRTPESIKDAEIEIRNKSEQETKNIEKQKNIEDEYDRINAMKKISEPNVTPSLIEARNKLDEFIRNN